MWYRRTVLTYGTVMQQSHNTVRYRTVPVQYCMVAVSVVRPERLRIAKLRNIAVNKKVSKDVSSRRRSAAFELLNGESFREGFCFFFKVLFSMRTRQVLQHLLRHLSHTRRGYLSCETATLKFPVKPALVYFAGLSSLWSWGELRIRFCCFR